MFEKLRKSMEEKGDSQQDIATFCGLRSYISIHNRMIGKTKWKERDIKLLCKRYKKSREELGF